MRGLIDIVPVRTELQYKLLLKAAAEDNHVPIYPTHLVTRDGAITGSLSVVGIPVVTFWSHSQKMTARSTFEVLNMAKNLGHAATGGKRLLTWCPSTSPIFPFMQRMGFQEQITTTHFLEEEK